MSEIVVAKRILPAPRHELARAVSDQIERILPGLSSREDQNQFAHAIIVAANELDPDKASPASVLVAAYGCCKLGLTPGKTLGLAYFVPFKGVCQLIVGYRGFLDLAFGNRFLKDIYTEVVYDGENFEYWVDETGPKLKHEPSDDRNVYKDKPIKAYGIAQLVSGGRQIRVIGEQELGKAYRDTPAWNGERHEQAMKTVVRRMAKQWKITPQMAAAVQWDEEAERGDSQSIGAPIDAPSVTVARRRRSLLAPTPTDASTDPKAALEAIGGPPVALVEVKPHPNQPEGNIAEPGPEEQLAIAAECDL